MPEYLPSTGKIKINEDGTKTHALIPTVFIGDGTTSDGKKFQILTTWEQAPVIRFEDGSQVVWDWNEIIEEAFEMRIAENEKN